MSLNFTIPNFNSDLIQMKDRKLVLIFRPVYLSTFWLAYYFI
jgi:hypothetical protein